MEYEKYKKYIEIKYIDINKEDIEVMFNNVENLYMNTVFPFDIYKEFDKDNKRATSWVSRAVVQLIENDYIDVLSYSENGLSVSLGTSMMNELTGNAGVI